MKLIFVRHGDPDYDNDTLTPRGKKESLMLVPRMEKLENAEFYVSPLGRAKDTAAPSMKKIGKEATVLSWLNEFPAVVEKTVGNGGRAWDLRPSYWTKVPEYYKLDEWYDTPLMKSGNVKEIYKDVCRKFDEFLAQHGYERNGNAYKAVKPNRKTIVFFCHFGIECVFLGHLLGISPTVLWHGFVAAPSSVTEVVTEEREEGFATFRTTKFGDISHLYIENQEPAVSARFCETFDNKNERH